MTAAPAPSETPVEPTGRTARQLWTAVRPPWRAVVTTGRGELEVGSLVEDPAGRLTPTGRPARIRQTRVEACESEAVRLVAEPGWRAVAYWARHAGSGWTIQGAWCWTRTERHPWPLDVRDLIALVASGEEPHPPPVVTVEPATAPRPRGRWAAETPDQALDRLRREWPGARSATERGEIAAVAAAVIAVRDAPVGDR